MLNGLDLFSGIGGLTIALQPWVRTVAYCESDPVACGVLLSRMAEHNLPWGPIWDDVRTLRGRDVPPVDIVFFGFPCQPYSSAARGRNKQDSILDAALGLCEEIQPKIIFLENVQRRAFDRCDKWLENREYKIEYHENRASDVGAPFPGRRCWFLATANGYSKSSIAEYEEVAELSAIPASLWPDDQPSDIRMDDGLPYRMDRLACLGNAVAWLQARAAFRALIGGA